jgi:hypothetical protein
MGSEFNDWIYWHFRYNYIPLWQLTLNDCLRLASFSTGLWVSSLLRDWLGSDIQVGHFFSFCCPLVNIPQLKTQLLNCFLNTPKNESLEFTNELPFITTRETSRDHRLQGFHYCSKWMCCLGYVYEPLLSKWIIPYLAPLFWLSGGVYQSVAQQMVVFRHYIYTHTHTHTHNYPNTTSMCQNN